MSQGLLLFAHGARDPDWARPFEAVAARVRSSASVRQMPLHVELGFLEFMQPDLLGAATRLAQAGCAGVDIVPLFLGAGGHVRKDLPALLDQLRLQFARIDWRLRPAVGEAQQVVDAMAEVSLAWADAAGSPAPAANHTARSRR